MVKTIGKLSFFMLSLMMFSSSAYAVIDAKKVVQRLATNVQMVIENVANGANVLQQVQANVLKGPMGAIQAQIVDLKSQVNFESFAPTVSTELQSVMGSKGLQSVPDITKYTQENLLAVNANDGIALRDAYVAVNERLNLSGAGAIAMAKEVLAKNNEAPKQADAQLAQVSKAENMQEKAVGEMGIDIQNLNGQMAQNQLAAKLLEVKAAGYMAIKQRSSLLEENGTTETTGGANEQNS